MGKRYSSLTDLPHLFLSSDNGTSLLEQRFSNTAPQPFLTTFFILKTTAIPLWCLLLSAYRERLERKAPSLSLVSSLLEREKKKREILQGFIYFMYMHMRVLPACIPVSEEVRMLQIRLPWSYR